MRIQKLLAVVLAFQVILWGIMGLNALGYPLSMIQQLLGFVYLIFIPGLLLLLLLRLHNVGIAETVLYAVGLSISALMFVGLFANTIFIAFGLSKPISFLAITGSVSFLVLLLCAIVHVRYRQDTNIQLFSRIDIPLIPALFLSIVPFISVFSTYLVNEYNINLGQLLLYLVLGSIALLIAFDKIIPVRLHAFAVFVIALSFLFQRTLISTWLTGWDIQLEYYLSSGVISAGAWDPSIYAHADAMLSVVLLPPMYALISNLDLVWVFKIIYPIIFALTSVALYRIFSRQLTDKIAFLSCFFFMSYVSFYTEMPAIAREQIAEFFFVLLILLLVSTEMSKMKQSVLFITFGLSLAVSHYALTYIFIALVFVMWLVLTFHYNKSGRTILPYLRGTPYRKNKQLRTRIWAHTPMAHTITLTYVALMFVASTAWYTYSSHGSIVKGISSISSQIFSSLTDFFNPTYSEALNTVATSHPVVLLHQLNALIYYANQLLIIAGLCTIILLKKRGFKFKASYTVLSALALGLVLASVIVPYLGASLTITRIYQAMLVFLAPFLAVGFVATWDGINKALKMSKIKLPLGNRLVGDTAISVRLLSVYLVVFMLFSTGFIFAVTEGYRTISLDNQIDDMQFNHREISGARWLLSESKGQTVYGDIFKAQLVNSLSLGQGSTLPRPSDSNTHSSYVFAGTYNINHNQAMISNFSGVNRQNYYVDFAPFIQTKSRIYSNGGAAAYW